MVKEWSCRNCSILVQESGVLKFHCRQKLLREEKRHSHGLLSGLSSHQFSCAFFSLHGIDSSFTHQTCTQENKSMKSPSTDVFCLGFQFFSEFSLPDEMQACILALLDNTENFLSFRMCAFMRVVCIFYVHPCPSCLVKTCCFLPQVFFCCLGYLTPLLCFPPKL